MFIGHLVGAEIVHAALPAVPWWIGLAGAAFPDLLWGAGVLAGAERVEVDPGSPLQEKVRFTDYPYSHSLVLTNIIACVPALALGALFGYQAGLAFLFASVSHWLVDSIVHLKDLPVLGFGKGERKVGLSLWRHPAAAFLLEYLLAAVPAVFLVPRPKLAAFLALALLFHLLNANAFFGFTRKNPIKTSPGYAVLVLAGFALLIAAFSRLLGA